jgi:integrase
VNELRRVIDRGGDPFAEEQTARDAAEAAQATADAEMTFARLVEEYYARHAEVHKAASSVAAERRNLRNHIPAGWNERKLSSFTGKDFLDLHFAVTKGKATKTVRGRARPIGGPIMANRVIALLRHMFAKAIKWEHLKGDNPVATIGREEKNPERVRERVYSSDEIQRLSVSLEQEPKAWRAYFALTLHYGTRKSELLSARWEHVDFVARTLIVPNNKASRMLVLPLDDSALPIIEALESRGLSEWLFPARGSYKHPHMSNAQGTWRRIRERAGITDRDAVIHTLRHTALTGLAAAGYNASTIQSVANHASLAMSQKYINRRALDTRQALENPSLPSFTRREIPSLPPPVPSDTAS